MLIFNRVLKIYQFKSLKKLHFSICFEGSQNACLVYQQTGHQHMALQLVICWFTNPVMGGYSYQQMPPNSLTSKSNYELKWFSNHYISKEGGDEEKCYCQGQIKISWELEGIVEGFYKEPTSGLKRAYQPLLSLLLRDGKVQTKQV